MHSGKMYMILSFSLWSIIALQVVGKASRSMASNNVKVLLVGNSWFSLHKNTMCFEFSFALHRFCCIYSSQLRIFVFLCHLHLLYMCMNLT